MIVVQVCGYAGSGKTTLCSALAEWLTAAGERVAYVKHHDGPLERAGSDTGSVAAALRLLAGTDGLLRLGAPPTLPELLAAAAAASATVTLVEGFKREPGSKIWLRRDGADAPPPDVPDVLLDLAPAEAAAGDPARLWRIAPRRGFPG